MDVLNKLNKLRCSLSNSVESTVFSTVSTITNALPGNPVTREFEVGDHVASAGPGLCWKVFHGVKKTTRQKAAIFVLERKSFDQRLESASRVERDQMWDWHKRAISQLTRLRHPQILTVQHPLEESRDCLAFATEPVFASLANVLGRHDNMPRPVPQVIQKYQLYDVEIKYGLLQLCDGLSFLHDGVKMLHRNLCPDTIILNESGAWKIFGFDFCLTNSAALGQPPVWNFPFVDPTSEHSLPDLDFLAPEFSLDPDAGVKLSPATDMFSLGMVAFTLYNWKPLLDHGCSWRQFQKQCYELKSLRPSNLQLIPAELKEYLKLLLNFSPELRPSASELPKISYFDDVGVKTLHNLDLQFQWDNGQKSQFYKGLIEVVPRLPPRVALHRVVPCLAKEFVNPHMVPFVLPVVLLIAQDTTEADFQQSILPHLKPVMKLTEPIQVLLLFMQRMDLLLQKTPPSDVTSHVLPMIYRALESDTPQMQELCLAIIPGFAGLLDYSSIKNALLPRIKKLTLQTSVLSVRVNALICLAKLLPHIDKWLVLDEVLPMLQHIPSREPAVVMAIIGIHKMALTDAKLGITKEALATKVLPFLFPLSIENGLTVKQYSTVMALIRDMMAKVEEEQLAKLQQLNMMQEQHHSALTICQQLKPKPSQLVATSGSAADQLLDSLGISASGSVPGHPEPPATRGSSSSSQTPLSLEQKQNILRQAENVKQMASGPLTPSSAMPASAPASVQVKDLTDALMASNVSQMSWKAGAAAQPATITSTATTTSQLKSHVSAMASADMKWTGLSSSGSHPPAGGKQIDLSAFDSLLPVTKPKPSLNSLNSLSNGSPGWNGSMAKATAMSPMTSSSGATAVQPLSASDICDLLS